MNKNISRLAKVAAKKSRTIVGLMSGTSMDGLDIALCKFENSGLKTRFKLLAFETVPYDSPTRSKIMEVFAKKEVSFEKLCILNEWIGRLHGRLVSDCLKRWKVSTSKVDAIASHGQTVFHSPAFMHPDENINATFQAGDGDHVAVETGIMTLSDFRQKHIAMGGEGAPLAVYGDFLLLSDKREDRILLNIGGIGNFTFLPGGRDASKVFVTDTGPGNTLIDQTVRLHFKGENFDKDAIHARRGTVHQSLLSRLKEDPFFKLPFPKTTGPELFNTEYVANCQRDTNSGNISAEDLLATLTRFSAETIALAVTQTTKGKPYKIYLSGGGSHNPLLVQWLSELLDVRKLQTTDDLGIPGDAKEAILFAVLANESLSGGAVDFGKRAKIPSASMGKISFPK